MQHLVNIFDNATVRSTLNRLAVLHSHNYSYKFVDNNITQVIIFLLRIGLFEEACIVLNRVRSRIVRNYYGDHYQYLDNIDLLIGTIIDDFIL